MKVIMAAAECAPFAKAGGLADVMGALPKELRSLGHEVTVLLPNYSLIADEYKQNFESIGEFEIEFMNSTTPCELRTLEKDGVRYIFIGNTDYFDGPEIYSQNDTERYGFFVHAVLQVMQALDLKGDVLHVHDWHTAMIPFLLAEDAKYQEMNVDLPCVLTIHNLQFQGVSSKEALEKVFGMDERYFHDGTVEWQGNFNSLKTGIAYARAITTVSPTYRDEILTEPFGERLDPLLKEREADLVGILNGIDLEAYNPAADPKIEVEFDVDSLEGKAANKKAIQKKFGLPQTEETPLMVMVSRLSGQKGIDVLEETLPQILQEEDVQFVLLGSGEDKYEQFFRELEVDFAGQVSAHIGFDEKLAHLLYAGADIFLMPSHFEPCGLSQLISMRYGTVPVANKTGGLKDTITDYDEAEKQGNGFLSDVNAGVSYGEALKRALSFFARPDHWDEIRRNGMNGDYSWTRSAKEYAEVYNKLVGK